MTELTDPGAATRGVGEVLEGLLRGRPPNRVLDAGCGFDSGWAGFPVPAAFADAHVTGIDILEQQVSRNTMLDEGIVGDIETYPFDAGSFDVIVCWYVLEHVPHPQRALGNLARAVAPGGVLVLGIPNVLSLKGLITKFTPYRFHTWAYKLVWSVDSADDEGHGPHPTHLRFALRRNGVVGFARDNGFVVEHEVMYGGSPFARGSALDRAWRASLAITRLVTLGRTKPGLSEMAFVLRKA